jgi:D-serine deaminase-like pyridoxal phosphate-dependent protein
MLSLKSQIKVAAISVLTLSVFLTGCAKKSFVVKTVDDKVAPIDKRVTDNTAAIKDNGERIDAVDRRATQGITAATTAATAAQTAAGAAQTTANQANTAAGTAQTTATQANTAAATANQGVTAANTRIAAVDAKVSAVDRYNPGPIQTVLFMVNSSVLSNDAKTTLDGVAGPIASMASGYPTPRAIPTRVSLRALCMEVPRGLPTTSTRIGHGIRRTSRPIRKRAGARCSPRISSSRASALGESSRARPCRGRPSA